MTYLLKTAASTRSTPQSEPIPGSTQVANNAGGYAWQLDDWGRAEQFLILGSEGGTYYVSERKLTADNAKAIARCIVADGPRLVELIARISEEGRAPKNDPALFALAMCAGTGDDATRRAAFDALPRVARIGTHLFHFTAMLEGFRGWGRGARKAIASWYALAPEKLAYQAIKYQQRDGWSHRDLLRLSHATPPTETHNALYHWMVKGWESVGDEPHPDAALRLVWAFERAKRATTAGEVATLIREYNLPREAVPTQWLNDVTVWAALLEQMPMTAMIRNLATMTRAGLLAPFSDGAKRVVAELGNAERLHKARVHPIALLAALKTYQQGHGERSTNTWTPVAQIVDALDSAFYGAFKNVTPTGKNWLLALDVSGSMASGTIAGLPGITPRDGSAAMALVTAATEPGYQTIAFSTQTIPLDISPRQRLDDVIKRVSWMPFGGTDCSQPMLWALERRIPAEVFVVYTDSETWAGKIHPAQALREYRQKTGIPAKLMVVGMTSNGFTIADPNDGGMLDFVGFDAAAPQVMAQHAMK